MFRISLLGNTCTLKMQIKNISHKVSELTQLSSYQMIKEKVIFKDLESLVDKLIFWGDGYICIAKAALSC